MEINLHLPEIKFADRPTKTQTSNMLNDIINFETKVLGSLLAHGDYVITDQWIAQAFNAVVQLKAAKDLLDGVANNAAAPRPSGPQPVR